MYWTINACICAGSVYGANRIKRSEFEPNALNISGPGIMVLVDGRSPGLLTFLLPGGRPRGLDWQGMYADVVLMVVVLGIDAIVVVVVTVLVGANDFGTADMTVSPADWKVLFGESIITALNPGNEMLSVRDDDPLVPHSSSDNRFAEGFFLAFSSCTHNLTAKSM